MFEFLLILMGVKKKSNVIKPKTPSEILKSVHGTSFNTPVKPAKNKKIIIYEDCATWAAVMKKRLEDEGYNVLIFENAIESVEQVKENKPDLVIMDINIPGISGIQATKMIKSKPYNKELPILILTIENSPQSKMNAMSVGARTFLTKNQPLEDLICAINAYMENTALKNDISQVIEINKMMKKN